VPNIGLRPARVAAQLPLSASIEADFMAEETATLARSAPDPGPLGAVIRVLNARATPSKLRLASGKCVLGSGSDADVVIAEPTVSRRHVELELVPEGIRVRDLNSHNGTYYLGQRLEQMVLAPGARLMLGATEVVIDADTESLAHAGIYSGDNFRGMLGVSASIRRLFATLERLDGSLVTVLVSGPSGVGKELAARAIHDGSSVRDGPLVVLNCATIPRELAPSELFGHRRGAFTGAIDTHRGAFECADGGTLFLDEIGELPLDVQPMLLRALETGEIRPVGGEQSRRVRVRLIAATNRDLRQEVAEGRFREDLYYRIAVVQVTMPPLSARKEDIEVLARAFAASLGLESLASSIVEQLKVHTWPGNVRELKNAIQAYAAIGVLPPTTIPNSRLKSSLVDYLSLKRPFAEQKDELVDLLTRLYLEALMEQTSHNQSQAARISGIDRTYLGRLLAKYGLSRG
jgi:transcriptional regulator with GAF, ATPase, and Fis domain